MQWRSVQLSFIVLLDINESRVWSWKGQRAKLAIILQRLQSLRMEIHWESCHSCQAFEGLDVSLVVLLPSGTWEGTSSLVTVSWSGWWSGFTAPMQPWTRSTVKARPHSWTRRSTIWCHSPLIASPQVEWRYDTILTNFSQFPWLLNVI